jgi:hypothetical protein
MALTGVSLRAVSLPARLALVRLPDRRLAAHPGQTQ